MILETKQVLFRAHVHSLDRRSRNSHDHLEQTIAIGSNGNINNHQSFLNDVFAMKYIIIWFCYKIASCLTNGLLTSEIIPEDIKIVKCHSNECPKKLYLILRLNFGAVPGWGALLYNGGYVCASGTFKPLLFADQTFGKISDPLQTNGGKFSKIYTPKRWKMNF